LNFKRKVVLKRSLKKKKNKTLPPYLSAQPGLLAQLAIPRRPASPSIFFFSFAVADARAPPVSLSIPLPFLLPLPRRPAAAAARIPQRPAFSPSFLSPASLPIKAFNRPGTIGSVSPFPAPSRDGRGHQ
jgi:hypothetical protein